MTSGRVPAGSALEGFLWWRVNTLLGPERTHVFSDADDRAALEAASCGHFGGVTVWGVWVVGVCCLRIAQWMRASLFLLFVG